jgi:hypothetical protein
VIEETQILGAGARWFLPQQIQGKQDKWMRGIGLVSGKVPNWDCRLQILDCRFQIADFRLQISDFRLQISDCRLLILQFLEVSESSI